MLLTKRDLELLETINELGYVDLSFVQDLWGIAQRTVYLRLRFLLEGNYLLREKVIFNSPAIYRLTAKSAENEKNALPMLRKISATSYRHNILVAKLSLKLIRQFGGRFISERRLRHEHPNAKANEHYSDGALELADKMIAIEVELTSKSNRRLAQIIKHYQKNLAYQEVWYFFDKNEVKKKLEKITQGLSFIKLFDLREFIEY